MNKRRFDSDFPEHSVENVVIWDANARWWDDRIGDGNDFQNLLIEPATERLLDVSKNDVILDIACGAGRFARRMAELGARVVAFDQSSEFISRARERTEEKASVEYHVLNTADTESLLSLGARRFNKAVCTMALMDMPIIEPLFKALRRLLTPGGMFVFSITHPCFNSGEYQRFVEMHEEEAGRNIIRTGIKISSYLTPFAKKTEGIIGQPKAQFHFHRPLSTLLQVCFDEGFIMDSMEEPGFPALEKPKAGVRWDDMPEVPPVMVIRLKLIANPE